MITLSQSLKRTLLLLMSKNNLKRELLALLLWLPRGHAPCHYRHQSSPELPWETVGVERAMNTQFGTVCFAESPTSDLVIPMPIGKVKTVKSVAKHTMVELA